MNALSKFASTFILGLGLVACSASGPGDSGDPNNPDNPDPEASMKIAGDYSVKSDFKVTPEKLGTGGDFALDLGKLADDPIEAIAEMLSEEIGIPSIFESQVERLIEEALGSNADKLSDTITDFLDASLNFQVVSTLNIDGSGRDLTMTHLPNGMEVTIDGKTYEYDFEGLKADTLESFAIKVTQEKNLEFPAHDLEIPYAEMLLTVLDEVVIPSLDENASNLGDALNNIIDCEAIGVKLDANITLPLFDPDADAWAGFCESGVDSLAAGLISEIGEIDSLKFDVTLDGRATALDDNDDNKADRIEGSWNSSFFGAVENEMAAPFKADRMR